MKILTLINNEWKQRVNPNITPDEKNILEDISEHNIEEKKSLIENIYSRSLLTASYEDALEAENIYNENKINGSELISVDITLPKKTGIINCRIDGEHKQIRF